jgi:hypothetical protein
MDDPFRVLEIEPTASEAEIRAAYRRLVKLHHPDHNQGSPEAARRFEAVQEAYAEIQRRGATGRTRPDPAVDQRLADLERQVRDAHQARERAQRAAREAAAKAATEKPRPTDEELGYIHTDDSLGQILADARAELADRFAHADEHPVVRRVSDLIDGLEELADKLEGPGKGPDKPR